MNIKENSWHWFIYSSFYGEDMDEARWSKLNFCKYARRVFLALVLGLFLACIGLAIVIPMISVWVYGIQHGLSFLHQDKLNNFQTLALYGFIMHILGALFGIVAFLKHQAEEFARWRRNRRWEKTMNGEYEPNEPGFFATWYSANKHKWCPTLTFVSQSTAD